MDSAVGESVNVFCVCPAGGITEEQYHSHQQQLVQMQKQQLEQLQNQNTTSYRHTALHRTQVPSQWTCWFLQRFSLTQLRLKFKIAVLKPEPLKIPTEFFIQNLLKPQIITVVVTDEPADRFLKIILN